MAIVPSGGGGYDLAPDGKTLVYAANHDKDEATSTNGDIWELAFADGAKARCLSCANHAFDGDPHYSPDGKRIAWTAQTQPGFESDRFDLVVYDRAAETSKRLVSPSDDWIEELATEWGWIAFPHGEEFGLIDASVMSGWVRIGTRRIAEDRVA